MKLAVGCFVITGGPSAGKSTTLADLAQHGYRTTEEVARTVIERGLAAGKTLQAIRADEAAFQRAVLREKIAFEATLPRDETVFLDRGMHDSLAYYRLQGVPVDDEIRAACAATDYCAIFLLELGQFVGDHARTETVAEARQLERLLERAYQEYDLPVVRIPFVSVPERTKLILAHLAA